MDGDGDDDGSGSGGNERSVAERFGPWLLGLGLVLSPVAAIATYRAHRAERSGASARTGALAGTGLTPRGFEITPDGRAIAHDPDGAEDPDGNDWGPGGDAGRREALEAEHAAERAFAEAKAPATGNAVVDMLNEGIRETPLEEIAFVTPDVTQRLTVLYKLIRAYNGYAPGRPGAAHGLLLGGRRSRDTLPTMEVLRGWFDALSLEQRVAIDESFHTRESFVRYWREIALRQDLAGTGIVAQRKPRNPAPVFTDPADVFVSPRDNRPFVIGLVPRRQAGAIIVREAEGLRFPAREFVPEQSERRAIDLSGNLAVLTGPDSAR